MIALMLVFSSAVYAWGDEDITDVPVISEEENSGEEVQTGDYEDQYGQENEEAVTETGTDDVIEGSEEAPYDDAVSDDAETVDDGIVGNEEQDISGEEVTSPEDPVSEAGDKANSSGNAADEIKDAAETAKEAVLAIVETPVLLEEEAVFPDAEVQEGNYLISSILDKTLHVGVAGGSYKEAANVRLSTGKGKAEIFHIKPIKGGLYTFMNVKSGKYIELAGKGDKSGTNVDQGKWANTDYQKWKILKDDKGNMKIVSCVNDLVLDIPKGDAFDKANIYVYKDNDSNAQRFTFKKMTLTDDLHSGSFYIRPLLDATKALEIKDASTANNGNLQINEYAGTDNQKFILTDIGGGKYTIYSQNSNKALDVAGGSEADGANVAQYTSNNTAAQKWKIVAAGDGSYYIKNATSGKYLDLKSGKSANGTNVQMFTGNNTSAQKFLLVEIDKKRIFPNGLFTIAMRSTGRFVFDISSGSKKDKANLQLYSSNNSNAQKFRFIYCGNGFYKIRNYNSGKYLHVSNSAPVNGGNVFQYHDKNIRAQKWRFIDGGNGGYYIRSSLGKFNLDVAGGLLANGTNIQIYKDNGSAAQKFKFIPTSPKKTPKAKIIEINPGHAAKANTGTEPIGPGSSTMKQKFTSGAQGTVTGLNEYELNLQVSLKLRTVLQDRGYKVYMTRTTNDTSISNKERAQKATQDKADLYIQIHANDVDSSSVNGVLNYAPADNNPYLSSAVIKDSQKLANLLTKYQCQKTGQKARETIYANDMTGINWATMPTSIVEMGFMSNPSEDTWMSKKENQQKIAEGIADGIDAYFKS